MKWFKFYGQDFLTDTKMRTLTIEETMCWVVLMCLANAEEKDGDIDFVSEDEVMFQAKVEAGSPMWEQTKGFIKKFEALRMLRIRNESVTERYRALHYDVTLLNFSKRQEQNFTNAEKQKKYRERLKQVKNTGNDRYITQSNERYPREEEKRIEKKREKRETPTVTIPKPEASISYLRNIPEEDLQEFILVFKTGKQGISIKAKSLLDYCEANGKKYKNYKAFLRNALRKDFGERTPEEIEQQKCTTEKLERFHAQNNGQISHVSTSIQGISEEERKNNLLKLEEMKQKSGIGKKFNM